MSTYMLILVCLSVITHHATSRMINTIADIDMNEDIESRGEMIRTMRGDIEIMLGLQSVIKTMLEEVETKGKERDEQMLKGLNRLLQNTSHVQASTEEEQGDRGVFTNITQTTESMQVSPHIQPEDASHGNLSGLVVITTTPLSNPNTASTTTTTTTNLDMIRNRQIYVRRFELYMVKRATQCEIFFLVLILEYVEYHTTKGISSGTEDVFLQTMDMATHVELFHQVFGTMVGLFLCAIRFYLKGFVYCISI